MQARQTSARPDAPRDITVQVWDAPWRVDLHALSRVAARVGESFPAIRSAADLRDTIKAIYDVEHWAQFLSMGTIHILVKDAAGKPVLTPPSQPCPYRKECFAMHVGYGTYNFSSIFDLIAGASPGNELGPVSSEEVVNANRFLVSSKDERGMGKCPNGMLPSNILAAPDQLLTTGAQQWDAYNRATFGRDDETRKMTATFFSSEYRSRYYELHAGFEKPTSRALALGDELGKNPESMPRLLRALADGFRQERCFSFLQI